MKQVGEAIWRGGKGKAGNGMLEGVGTTQRKPAQCGWHTVHATSSEQNQARHAGTQSWEKATPEPWVVMLEGGGEEDIE